MLLGATLVVGALTGGCAQFPDQHARDWHEKPSLEPQAGPQPYVEGQEKPPPRAPGIERTKTPPPPKGCNDPDPAVIATCLAPVGAIAVLPGGDAALVGERTTGRILRVRDGEQPVEVARIPVDAAAGGLTGLTLSPSYGEDQLAYAYVTTATDNRVVRIAPGDPPEPILTGIPKGPANNDGAIIADGRGALLVATGNAGSPANAADPASLAGKILRTDAFGNPAEGNPEPGSAIVSSGLVAPGGLCAGPGRSSYWVTDHGSAEEALHRITPGQPLGVPAWTWPDRPGVSGCVAGPNLVAVALSDAAAVYTLQPARGGSFTGKPRRVLQDTYGRFSAAALGPKGLLWLGTANKAGGKPVSSDDRVIKIQPPSGDAAGKD